MPEAVAGDRGDPGEDGSVTLRSRAAPPLIRETAMSDLPRPDWQSDDGSVVLYCADCREILPKLAAGSIDAVVTDPPYGIAYDASHSKYKNGIDRGDCLWDVEPYDPAPILALGLPSIVWGGNCFSSRLPDATGWIAWVKIARQNADIRQSDCELAWTNCLGRSRVFNHLWIGAYRASESGVRNVHPTQKPIALMSWCLGLMPSARTILDPYMGSGTTGVACIRTGRRFIGIEIERKYFDIAVRRCQEALLVGADMLPGISEPMLIREEDDE